MAKVAAGGDGPVNASSSKPTQQESVWLNAWHDPVAGLKTHGMCVRLVDLYGDGDSKLLVADRERKLTVFKGPHIFIYRNLRPHYKFSVPPVPVPQPELDVWEELRAEAQPNVEAAVQSLLAMRDEGKKLTSRSLDLLGISDPAVAYEFVEAEKHTPLTQQTVITCMEVLQKSEDGELGMSSLVIGTESKKVYIIKHTGYSVACECELPSVPVMMAITGSYSVGYRIVVACRDAKIYTIKGQNANCQTNVGTSMVIELEAQPCGLVREGKAIYVGTMGNQFHSFHIKGKKNFTVYLPAHITQMELLSMKGSRKVQACVLALSNGEVRVYNDKALVSSFNIKDEVTGLRFGKFGREDNSLILTLKSGALSVKMLPRNVDLEKSKMHAGPPPEQDIPLTVPKKTKLYIEQTQRERDQAVEMHRLFQRDLCKLRLATARAYVKVLTDGHGPLSYTAGSSLRLNPQVQGLGPIFKLKLDIQNTGNRPIFDVPLAFSYNQQVYKLSEHLVNLPVLIPGVMYKTEISCHAIAEGVADVIRVFVMSPKSIVPVITATVNMPLAEPM